MQRIPIKYANPGMILGKAVARDNGMVLAGEGLNLTDSILERLRTAGIGSIVVKGRPIPGLDTGDIDLAQIKNRLGHLFRKYRQNPLMWTLRNMLEQYFDRTIAMQEEAQREERTAMLAEEKNKK